MSIEAVWFERCEPQRVEDWQSLFSVMVYGYLHLPPGIKMMVQSAEAADALEARLAAGWLPPDKAERLRALTATCCCGTSPMTYEGPQPECPVHGAVRAFNEASRQLAAVQPVIDAARQMVESLRLVDALGYGDSFSAPARALMAAFDALDADSPPEGPKQ